ncbi:MAG TPA: hypothetical protein VGC42_14780 [Kofleriaceae bacterium]
MRDEPGSNHRARWLALFTLLCPAVHGCDAGSGGAVELSWKLRPNSSSLEDKFVDCDRGDDLDRGDVAYIQLAWQVTGDQGEPVGGGSEEWRCNDNHGVTGFSLPEGTASLTVIPECRSGTPAASDTYSTPAPVQRQVMQGNTISLGAVELVIDVSGCDDAQPCICK